MNPLNAGSQNRPSPVVRAVPYPYRAMLAICSDLDETPDGTIYYEIMRYLNTTESTSMGQGVGLEVGNTIYFDMPPGQFAYWSTDDANREMVRSLIRSGHIDCLHSFGDLASSRQFAERALEELDRHDCRISVWIDHATAPTNFGSDIMQGQGDLPESPVYHADLTCGFGVRYVWRGRVTSIIGQDVACKYSPIWTAKHPILSAQTLGKEVLKNVLARCGSSKYAMHRTNDLTREVYLRNGQPVTEFIRCDPFWGGVGKAATAGGLAEVLDDRYFSTLVRNGGLSILYTHIGKITNIQEPFGLPTRLGWSRLAEYYRSGQILVSTTARLLNYRNVVRKTQVIERRAGEWQTLHIAYDGTITDLAGLTIYVDDPAKSRMYVNNQELKDIQRNPADSSGSQSVSVPWVPLQFPDYRR